jgi:hypothetical protein
MIMKKILISLFLTACFFSIQAQQEITVTGGLKMIHSEQKMMTLWYVDESPSRDNIFANIDPVGKFNADLSIRIQEILKGRKFHFFADIQGYLGSVLGLAVNAGYVYNKNNENKWKILPELAGSLGFSRRGIGDIANNDLYIQVNEIRFADNTNVFVGVNNIHLGLKPGLSISCKLGNENRIGIRANYQISYKIGKLSFSGTGQDGNPESASESLDANNVGFYVDGVKSTKVPFNPDGFEFKLFYTFNK